MKHEELGLLANIQYPDDLRRLKVEQLPEVCEELRRDILDELSVNPKSILPLRKKIRSIDLSKPAVPVEGDEPAAPKAEDKPKAKKAEKAKA